MQGDVLLEVQCEENCRVDAFPYEMAQTSLTLSNETERCEANRNLESNTYRKMDLLLASDAIGSSDLLLFSMHRSEIRSKTATVIKIFNSMLTQWYQLP